MVAYMLILDNDSNAEVRRAVLSCIAMSPSTLLKVLKRTRDVKESVRKLAYQVTPPLRNSPGFNALLPGYNQRNVCNVFFEVMLVL